VASTIRQILAAAWRDGDRLNRGYGWQSAHQVGRELDAMELAREANWIVDGDAGVIRLIGADGYEEGGEPWAFSRPRARRTCYYRDCQVPAERVLRFTFSHPRPRDPKTGDQVEHRDVQFYCDEHAELLGLQITEAELERPESYAGSTVMVEERA